MKPRSSNYILDCRREYSLYVMQQRAIPASTDGLKAAARRVLWMARDGKKHKSAVLAGACMPIHPHASPEDAVDTITAPYGNNIPLLKGYGTFGTLLGPKDYGASRYTSVTLSKFSQDVIMRDIEIIPMQENYDSTLDEPIHFLPLIPVALLNPTEGIAVGFATNILPRTLDDIIIAQITHLTGGNITAPIPKFAPTNSVSHKMERMEKGIAYYFDGEFERINSTTIKIKKIPYGLSHTKVITKIFTELEKGNNIVDYKDDSRDIVNITVKFKKGVLSEFSDEEILKMLGLSIRHIENLNVLTFDGKSVWPTDPVELIGEFTDWRLKWYVNRYTRLRDLLLIDIQKYRDIQTAIENNVGGIAKKIQSRSELKEFLAEIKIVYTDFIADLPVYRFTEEEKRKNEEKIKEALIQLKRYEDLLESEQLRKEVYISELKEILTNYTKGTYSNEQ